MDGCYPAGGNCPLFNTHRSTPKGGYSAQLRLLVEIVGLLKDFSLVTLFLWLLRFRYHTYFYVNI